MVTMQTIVSHYALSFGKIDPRLGMQGNLKDLARAIKGNVWSITKPTQHNGNMVCMVGGFGGMASSMVAQVKSNVHMSKMPQDKKDTLFLGSYSQFFCGVEFSGPLVLNYDISNIPWGSCFRGCW